MAASSVTFSAEDLRSAPPQCLFKSPHVPIKKEVDSDVTEDIIGSLKIEEDTKKYLETLQKELHQQRLENLRSLIPDLSKGDWMYPSVNKLIGNR